MPLVITNDETEDQRTKRLAIQAAKAAKAAEKTKGMLTGSSKGSASGFLGGGKTDEELIKKNKRRK